MSQGASSPAETKREQFEDVLPNEVWRIHIFPYLTSANLLRLCRVNRFWNTHVPRSVLKLDPRVRKLPDTLLP